jgi:predicted amidohydrolase YtcJ
MEYLLIEGGKVWTGAGTVEEALLLGGDKVIAVGSKSSVQSHPKAAKAKKIALKGETVIPGMTDSHLHLTAVAKYKVAIDLSDVKSKEEFLQRIKKGAENSTSDSWVYASRLNEAHWDRPALPTREDLDSLNLPNPIVVTRICSHTNVVNTNALEKCGIPLDADIEGAVKGLDGKLNGILHEQAGFNVVEKMKKSLYTQERVTELVAEKCHEIAAYGLTAIHPCGAFSYGLEESLEVYQSLRAANRLSLRVFAYFDFMPNLPISSGLGDDWVKYQGWKTFLDGSLGAATAAFTEPYSDNPESCGLLNHSLDEVKAWLEECQSRGIQALIHVIGDRALDQALDAIEYVVSKRGTTSHSLPVRLAHTQLCRPDQIKRMASLRVVCDIQPMFLPSDMHMAPSRLGEKRLEMAYPWRSLYDGGLLLTGSSDTPAESINPWTGVWAAVNRTGADGKPEEGWTPKEKLTLEQALKIYTVNPYKAMGYENIGTLEVGKKADVVVLNNDIWGMPTQKLKDVTPQYVFVDGLQSVGDLTDWPTISK